MYNKLDFTIYSEDSFYDVVDTESFRDEDAEVIYNHLNEKMKLIPFGNYLKRYIFKKAGFDGDFDDIDIRDYQHIIIDSFNENFTPKSFGETSTKMSALAKNWLTQTSVKREIVFLLGFGLNMEVEDVSEFLVNALGENDFNFKNPFEIICWYCFNNRLKYPDFVRFYEMFENLPVDKNIQVLDTTVNLKNKFLKVRTEDELLTRLLEIKSENSGSLFSVTARENFRILFDEAKKIIAEEYTKDEKDAANKKASEYLSRMSYSDKLSDEEKSERAKNIRNDFKEFNAEDINAADVEKFLCCGVPFDHRGNLLKFSKSTLAKHFKNKRMSRNHIREISNGECEVERFDLITLNFFKFAMNENVNNKIRYFNFVDSTNEILERCSMGKLYVANPYECFLMMCILSDWPMGSYSDVLELSFNDEL